MRPAAQNAGGDSLEYSVLSAHVDARTCMQHRIAYSVRTWQAWSQALGPDVEYVEYIGVVAVFTLCQAWLLVATALFPPPRKVLVVPV